MPAKKESKYIRPFAGFTSLQGYGSFYATTSADATELTVRFVPNMIKDAKTGIATDKPIAEPRTEKFAHPLGWTDSQAETMVDRMAAKVHAEVLARVQAEAKGETTESTDAAPPAPAGKK